MTFEAISEYYERHAGAWARQCGGRSGLMHAGLRKADGLSRLRQQHAFEEWVVSLAEALDARRVFDLGCGFCSSLFYLLNIRPDTQGIGICASQAELETSRERIRLAGLVQNVSVFKGDFEESRNYRVFPAQDIVFALDSWRHVRDMGVSLGLMAQLVRKGGRLLVADWFRDRDVQDEAERKLLDALESRLGVSALPSAQAFQAAAASAGFSLLENQAHGDRLATIGLPDKALGPLSPIAARFLPAPVAVLQARTLLEKLRRRGLIEYRRLEFLHP